MVWSSRASARRSAPGVVSLRDRREDRVIEGGVTDAGLLGQQIPALTEERCPPVEDGTDHPSVEVLDRFRPVAQHELVPVGRGAADDRMEHRRQPRIRYAPEFGGLPIGQGLDHELQAGAPTQRCPAREDLARHRQRGAADQHPCVAGSPMGASAQVDFLLEEGRDRGVGLHQVGELVGDQRHRTILGQREEEGERVPPVRERVADRGAGLPGQGHPEQAEQLDLRALGRLEVEAPESLGQVLEQEGLPLPAANR